MQGKIQKFDGLTPFEEEHQQQQSHEERLAGLSRRQFLTRGQWWHGYGRRVTKPNIEARKTIVTQSGRTLYLFSADQLLPQVSAKRTASCKDSRRIAMWRHDQALKESLDEVAKAGFRAGT